jgi:hypothetical protein
MRRVNENIAIFTPATMDITESQLLRVSVIEYWGCFASSDLEERFRSQCLVDDSKTANFLALLYIFSTVVFACVDWALKGVTPTFLILIVPRSVILLSSTALILRLHYAITPLMFDRWLLGWFSLNLLMELYFHSTRMASETAVFGILFVWVLSSLVPMRFSYQAGAATVAALAFMALIIGKKPEPSLLASTLIAWMLALTVGLVCSRRLHRACRQSFAAHLLERETGVLLEATLAQLRTLEGILSICAACKKIREEDGAWVGLDEYVTDHSAARFSHGMCPDCIARLYPNYSPQSRKS